MEIKKNNGVLYIKTQKKDKKIMSQALMDEKQFLANQKCGMEAEGTEMFLFQSAEALKKALAAAAGHVYETIDALGGVYLGAI